MCNTAQEQRQHFDVASQYEEDTQLSAGAEISERGPITSSLNLGTPSSSGTSTAF